MPTVIKDYVENARHWNHKDIFFVIIGDRKSPETGCEEFLAGLDSEYPIHYFGVQAQKRWLKPYKALKKLIPWNSVQRRNLGYLIAAQRGAEIIIAIDDDNIPLLEYDYFGYHGQVGEVLSADVVSSSDNWFNSCSLLVTEPHREIYHRGFPISRRWTYPEIKVQADYSARIRVNVGLWLEDPDVDTVTRLEQPFIVSDVREPRNQTFFARGLWGPFNSQNTAFAADLLPAMFLITLRKKTRGMLKGNRNFRYDDIWMSYFLKKVIDQEKEIDGVAGGVLIGPPHVKQLRNPHNYLLDLEKELYPMQLTDRFPALLDALKLSASKPFDCYAELADQLHSTAKEQELGYDKRALKVFKDVAGGMKIWLDTLQQMSLF